MIQGVSLRVALSAISARKSAQDAVSIANAAVTNQENGMKFKTIL